MDAITKYNTWIDSELLSYDDYCSLRTWDDNKIKDRFSSELHFGTGGVRAKMGLGTNRLNKYTIRKITLGYINYLKNKYETEINEKGIVIAYDVRYNSQDYAEFVAQLLKDHGFKVFVFDSPTPTPELSFFVRYLNAIGGIVITASHNPSIYNGYKIYDASGCQLDPSTAWEVTEHIEAIGLDYMNSDNLNLRQGTVEYLSKDLDNILINEFKELVQNRNLTIEDRSKLRILYTPLHGTGSKLIFSALNSLGYCQILTVEKQNTYDPKFSNVSSPNPEDISAFDEAIKYAKESNIDLIMGTDPDADRLGVLERDKEGNFIPLTGNQIGALIVDYLLNEVVDNPENYFVVNTVVTGELGIKIAKKYGVTCFSTLTGFKNIGNKMNEVTEKNFLFAWEESYGFLVTELLRDKDSVSAAMLISEMATLYKKRGYSLYDRLQSIMAEHGFYIEKLISKTLTERTTEESSLVEDIMLKIRTLKSDDFEKYGIEYLEDFRNRTDELKSNLVKIHMKDGWIAVRPSGTEPKIKFYISSCGSNKKTTEQSTQNKLKFVDWICQ